MILLKDGIEIWPCQVLQFRLLQLPLWCKILIFLSKTFKKSSIKRYILQDQEQKTKPVILCEILYAAKGRKQNLNFCYKNLLLISTSTRTCRKTKTDYFLLKPPIGGDKSICNTDGIYAMDFATNAGKEKYKKKIMHTQLPIDL